MGVCHCELRVWMWTVVLILGTCYFLVMLTVVTRTVSEYCSSRVSHVGLSTR